MIRHFHPKKLLSSAISGNAPPPSAFGGRLRQTLVWPLRWVGTPPCLGLAEAFFSRVKTSSHQGPIHMAPARRQPLGVRLERRLPARSGRSAGLRKRPRTSPRSASGMGRSVASAFAFPPRLRHSRLGLGDGVWRLPDSPLNVPGWARPPGEPRIGRPRRPISAKREGFSGKAGCLHAHISPPHTNH